IHKFAGSGVGAGQAVRRQCVDLDARSAALGLLRFASAGYRAHQPPAGCSLKKMNAVDLQNGQCAPQHSALSVAERAQLLWTVPAWRVENERLVREFRFDNYYATMAFVNAVAWIAHQQDHHPELTVGYNRCTVR